MVNQRKRQRGGGKEYGKNLVKCHIYRTENRREKNKIKKLKKYLRNNPNDKQMEEYLNKLIIT